MATVRDVVKSALRRINAYGDGEALSAETGELALETVNYIFEQWTLDKLMSYQVVQENYPLTINQQDYTIGASGNFNTTRPIDIQSAFIRYDDTDYQLFKLTDDEWSNIGTKDDTSTFPRYFYYRPAFPLGTISFYGKPTDACTVYLNLTKVFAAGTLDTALSFPPGYTEMLALDLAIRLAPIYAYQVPAELYNQRYDLFQKIAIQNSQVWTPITDVGVITTMGGDYDVYSDSFITRARI